MRNIVVLAAMAAIFALPQQAHASKWKSVGYSGVMDGVWTQESRSWEVDSASIKKSGGVRRVWVQTQQLSEGPGVSHVASKVYYKIDCRGWTMETLSSVEYDKYGAVVSSASKKGYPADSSEPIVPDSMGDAVAKFVCR